MLDENATVDESVGTSFAIWFCPRVSQHVSQLTIFTLSLSCSCSMCFLTWLQPVQHSCLTQYPKYFDFVVCIHMCVFKRGKMFDNVHTCWKCCHKLCNMFLPSCEFPHVSQLILKLLKVLFMCILMCVFNRLFQQSHKFHTMNFLCAFSCVCSIDTLLKSSHKYLCGFWCVLSSYPQSWKSYHRCLVMRVSDSCTGPMQTGESRII